jgi:hypothetical protein
LNLKAIQGVSTLCTDDPNRCVIISGRTHRVEGRGMMPRIFFYGPDLDDIKKKELIRDFTEAIAR